MQSITLHRLTRCAVLFFSLISTAAADPVQIVGRLQSVNGVPLSGNISDHLKESVMKANTNYWRLFGKSTALALVVLLVLVGSAPVAEADSWVRPDWSRVQKIASGTKTRVQLYKDQAPRGKGEFDGIFRSATAGCITLLLPDGKRRTLQKQAVRKVLVFRPLTKRYQGWIAAAVATAIIVGAAATAEPSSGDDLPGWAGALLVGGAVGAPIGITFAAAPKWGGVYNVPIEQRDAAAQTPPPETAVFPLLETSGPDQFRLQARRLLMRKDIPLDLSPPPPPTAPRQSSSPSGSRLLLLEKKASGPELLRLQGRRAVMRQDLSLSLGRDSAREGRALPPLALEPPGDRDRLLRSFYSRASTKAPSLIPIGRPLTAMAELVPPLGKSSNMNLLVQAGGDPNIDTSEATPFEIALAEGSRAAVFAIERTTENRPPGYSWLKAEGEALRTLMDGFEKTTSDQDRKEAIEASLNELVNGGFLTEEEAEILLHGFIQAGLHGARGQREQILSEQGSPGDAHVIGLMVD